MSNTNGQRRTAILGTCTALAAGTLVALAPSGAGAEERAQALGKNTIIFSSLRDGDDEIYVMNVDGSQEQQLTNVPGFDTTASISPDRRSIAFASDRTGQMQIYRMAADGSAVSRLTNSDTFDFFPTWFDDGARIVFQRQTTATGFDLWVMDADGTDERRLTNFPANEVGGWVSPDDTTVVFASNTSGNRDIWTVPADGGAPVNLTAGTCIAGSDPCSPTDDVMPTWTPDGQIVFVSNRSGTAALWTMAADGSRARLVIDLSPATVALPNVSANGQWITFISNVDDLSTARSTYTVRLDGTHLRRLTTTDDLHPRFAPTTR